MKDNIELHIDKLVGELEPSRTAMKGREFILKFFGLCLFIFIISLSFLPIRESLNERLSETIFHFENFLWFFSSCLAGYAAYSMSLPLVKTKKVKRLTFLCLAMLLMSVLTRISYGSLNTDVVLEMQLWRGWCGGIIVIYGLLLSAPIYYCMRQGLNNGTYIQSSLLLSIAGGGAASFLMQVVCDHNSAMHILLWHFTSVFTLFIILALYLKKKRSL